MNSLRLAPPPRPRPEEDSRLYKTIKWSLIIHFSLIVLITVQGVFFSSPPKPYIPTLKVDLVGLPDQLKNERNKPTQAETKDISKKSEPIPEDSSAMKIPSKTPAREKRLKSALERIKALDKVSVAEDEKPTLLKGNKISKGTSTSDDAKESNEQHYFDSIRDRLQTNWALPVWLARQNLSARAQVFIDANGRLRSFKIVKTSGNVHFDEAVKRTITESSPFAKPDQEIASSVLYDGILVGFPL